MFTNVLRTQARLALSSSRVSVPAVSLSRLVFRAPIISSLPVRLLSTSRPILDDYRTGGYSRDRSIQNSSPPSNNLFIGNLPFSAEELEIREKFEPFGKVVAVRISYRVDGSSRGFGHVEFANKQDAISAYESAKQEPVYLLDRNLRVEYSTARTASAKEPSNKLYFAGFSRDEETLRSAFQTFENFITDIHFLKDRETGEFSGSGFINFTSTEYATDALKTMHGTDIEGEPITLQYARPRRERSDSGPQRRGGYPDARGGRSRSGYERQDGFYGGNRGWRVGN